MLSVKKYTSNTKTLVELSAFSKPVGHKVNQYTNTTCIPIYKQHTLEKLKLSLTII